MRGRIAHQWESHNLSCAGAAGHFKSFENVMIRSACIRPFGNEGNDIRPVAQYWPFLIDFYSLYDYFFYAEPLFSKAISPVYVASPSTRTEDCFTFYINNIFCHYFDFIFYF